MQFGLTEEQQLLVDSVRQFVETELAPYEDDVERTDHVRPELIRQIHERALKAGKLAEVATEAAKLTEQARAPAAGWLEKVNARASVERAIAAVEQELKSSLATQSQGGKKG